MVPAVAVQQRPVVECELIVRDPNVNAVLERGTVPQAII